MPTKAEPGATLTTVAEFPKEYFLESIVVRKDGSMLVTVFISQELWYVPPPHEKLPMKACSHPLFRAAGAWSRRGGT